MSGQGATSSRAERAETTVDRQTAMRVAAVVAIPLAVVGLFGAVGTATADETVVDECTTLDEDGETYVLEEDLVNQDDDVSFECIEIDGDNIVFDGQGHTLSDGTGASPALTGITVASGGFSPNTGVEIRNVELEDWERGGIRLRGDEGFSGAPTVKDVEIRDVASYGIEISSAFVGSEQTIEDVVIEGVEDGIDGGGFGIDADSGSDDTSNEFVNIEVSDTDEEILLADGDEGDSLERFDVGGNLTSGEANDVNIDVVGSPSDPLPTPPPGTTYLDTVIGVEERDDGSLEQLRLYYDDEEVPDDDTPAIWQYDGDWERLDTAELGDEEGGTFVEASEDVTEFGGGSVFAVLADEPEDPTAAFDVDPVEPVENQEVIFDASDSNSPNDAIDDYRWEFDDGTTETTSSETTTKAFDDTGTYTVELEIEDEVGETDTTTEQVIVTEDPSPDCGEVTYSEDGGDLLVGTAAELQCLGDGDADIDGGGTPTLDDDYRLVEDINLTAANVAEWNGGDGFESVGVCQLGPGGCTSESDDRFSGTFDGDGHTIEGLVVSGGAEAGLFSALDGATVERVGLVDVDVTAADGGPTGPSFAGGLAAVGDDDAGTPAISEVFVSGDVSAPDGSGGFVAQTDGIEMTDVYSLADVDAGSAAGLVGFLGDGTIDSSYAAGEVESEFAQSAGLVENSENSDVTDSYWDVPATGTDVSEGGEDLGELGDDAPAAEMTGEDAPANMTGFGFGDEWSTVVEGESLNPRPDSDGYPILTALDAQTQLDAQDIEPSEKDDTEIEDWNDLDDVRSDLDGEYVLANELNETTDGYGGDGEEGVVLDADGNLQDGDGFEPIGDFGSEFTGTFDGEDNEIEGLVIDRENEDQVGLFGVTNDATIENVGLIDVDATGESGVGGLVGENNNGDIKDSSATGTVTGDEDVGGLVGINSGGLIGNSYATASVTGEEKVGGLLGEATSIGTVEGSYAIGDVDGEDRVGGLVGQVDESPVEESYGRALVFTSD